jgi:hypothetical protein
MEEKGDGGFMKKGIVYKCFPNQFNPCNHITLVWDGVWLIVYLLWYGASHNYIRVRGTL